MTAAHLLSGPDSYVWTDNPTYLTAHYRVYAKYGKATLYTCECGSQAHEWAYAGGCDDERIDPRGRAYSPDPDHYVAMCRSCHRAYDRFERSLVA